MRFLKFRKDYLDYSFLKELDEFYRDHKFIHWDLPVRNEYKSVKDFINDSKINKISDIYKKFILDLDKKCKNSGFISIM